MNYPYDYIAMLGRIVGRAAAVALFVWIAFWIGANV